MNKQYLGTYTIDETPQQNKILKSLWKKDNIIKTPQIDLGRFGVNANGGCALGFNTNQGAWEYQTQNFQFYLADYDQPVGAYWGASHRDQTPQGGHR